MIPLEDRSLVKNYPSPDTEIEAALQTNLSQVSSEDPAFSKTQRQASKKSFRREARSFSWAKGVQDFEPVSLFCDQLTKVRPWLLCII